MLPIQRVQAAEPRSATRAIGQLVGKVLPIASEPAIERSLGRGVVAAMLIVPLAPIVGVAVLLFAPISSVRKLRRQAQTLTRASIDALSEVIDLFAMALSSGVTATAAVQQAAVWAPDPLRVEFGRCVNELRIGKPLGDALEAIPERAGNHVRPLVAALVAHDRYGAPVIQNLSQLAADARRDRRRRAEADARRLPVTLLFPLVVCVLPAFLLLTVIPVVVDTITSFSVLASL